MIWLSWSTRPLPEVLPGPSPRRRAVPG